MHTFQNVLVGVFSLVSLIFLYVIFINTEKNINESQEAWLTRKHRGSIEGLLMAILFLLIAVAIKVIF